MRGSTAWLAPAGLAALAALTACADDPMRAPFAPSPDGSFRDAVVPGSPPSGGGDAGPADAGGDGSVDPDAGLTGCVAVAPSDATTNLTVLQSTDRPPFELEAAFLRWNTADCGNPMLLVGLTDGACEPGLGQQLLFAIAEPAIGSVVTEGDYVLGPEPTPLRLTFSRPAPGMPGAREVFGTCGEVAGTITFDSVGTAAGTVWQAHFTNVDLGPCATTTDPGVTIDGAFRLTLARSFEEACP